MPFEENERKWVLKLGAALKVSVKFEEQEKTKNKVLSEVFAEVDSIKADIKAGMTFSVTQDGKVVESMTKDSEQIDEIETMEASQGSSLSVAEIKRAGEAQHKVVAMQKKLESTLKAAGFSKAEIQETIREEFYFPLVREKLMPENLVPGKYSKTQEMLDATNQLYQDAIKKLPPKEGGVDKYAMAKKGIGYAATVAKSITSMVGGHTGLATNLIGLTELVLTTGVTVAEAISKNDLRGSSEDILGNLGTILTNAVSIYNPTLGKAVGAGYTGLTKTAMVVKYLTDSPPNYEKALDSFAAGLIDGFTAGAKLSGMDKTQADYMIAAATAAGGAMKAGRNLKTIKEAIEKRDFAGLVDGVTKMGEEAVTVGLKCKSAVEGAGKSDGDKDKLNKENDKLTSQITAGMEATKLVLKTGKVLYDAATSGKISGAAEAVVGNIGDALSGMLGAFAPKGVASTVAAAYKTTASAGLVATYLVKGDHAKAIATLGDGLAAAMELCNPDPNDKSFATAGKALAAAFKAGAKAAEIAKLLDKKEGEDIDIDALIDLLTSAGKDATKNVLDIKSAYNDAGTNKQEKQIGADVDKGIGMGRDAAKGIAELLKKNPKAKEVMKAKLGEVQAAEAKEEIEREKKEFDRMLTLIDEGGEAAADSRSVEKLIQQMQRDKLIMDLVLKIGGAGLDMAAKYVPGLAIAGAAVKLAASIAAAANRALALNKWLEQRKDGKAAASVYSSSINNFVTNQQEQFAYYTIKAALELVQLIGASISVSGLGATVGEPMQKAAALAETGVDLAKELYDEAMLERAWNTTKLALKNRENRKLGLIARKQNPTLAKYSIAWGAVEKKDALAKSAMASCGLNATTLAQKDTNVSNVVKYLETMFPDDRQVKRGLPTPGGWKPSEVTLSARCFMAGKLAAEKKGKLAQQETGAIEGCFVAVAEVEVRVTAAKKEKTLTKEILDEYDTELTRLAAALKGYKPKVETSGGEHTDMKDFVKEIAALVEVESKLLVGMRKELAKAGAPDSSTLTDGKKEKKEKKKEKK